MEFIRQIIEDIRTTLFYRFGIGGEKMPPDMLEAVLKYEKYRK